LVFSPSSLCSAEPLNSGGLRMALLSQIPMLVLLVGYTLLSLWILSQPIVETAPAG
jgi:hypothetical protein